MSPDRQTYTILGAGGFIGAALVAWLESQDQVVHAVTRASLPALMATRRPVGHVIDCIGLTGDCRTRPLETAEAHVGLVARCLSELQFASFLLLSSIRVYRRASVTHEDTPLPSLPADPADLFSMTKLAGEALCLANPRPEIRVARLSQVYGMGMRPHTFLGQILREGRDTGRVMFRYGPGSTRDYVNLSTVVRLLPAIAATGQHRTYNLAAGGNTSLATIAYRLREILGWQTSFAADAPTLQHLPIDIIRLKAEFGPTHSSLSADLPTLLTLEQEYRCLPSMNPLAV